MYWLPEGSFHHYLMSLCWVPGAHACNPSYLGFSQHIDIILLFCCCAGWGTCGIYKSSYNVANVSYLNSPPPPFSFSPPPPIPGIVSTGLRFPFTQLCAQYLYHSHPPTPFPQHLLVPTGTNPPLPTCRTCFTLLFSDFVEEKRKKRNDIFACLK
jgi:hypothetical protein